MWVDRLLTKEVPRDNANLLRHEHVRTYICTFVRSFAASLAHVKRTFTSHCRPVRVQSRWYSALETRCDERVPWIHSPCKPGAIVMTMIARVRSRDAGHSLSLYFASFHFYLRMIYATSHCCATTPFAYQKILHTSTYAYKGISTIEDVAQSGLL